ncbi:O-succinylbenzoic acid--CoA ligase [Streptosporangium becharense]|uniref:O-succinylbenzoic acid--CoA ligase n=1 Tax=Streptosporangium becharense TaxID=1816182 RepID=A0A7W9IBG3_9ACTN|nr:AMP-binding protein [Streptosporangium becharense]MBB2915436.1 O-succinylbenzoic acid--CoA ligase [Streptosporangium becharense]MBB5817623.1 O-succinylbenzoic acid--CoA ligase [Streptosporangium becharense]
MTIPVHEEWPSAPRALNAVVSTPGPELFRLVGEALSGEGPAVLPLSPALPAPALRAALDALRPTHVDGVRRADGVGVPAEVAVVIATSGSTGAPKGVQLSAAALRASASASLRRLGARPGERWLCCLPPSHVSGLQVLVRSLLGGTEPVVHDGFSPEAVLASGADHVSLVPTQLRRLLHADLSVFGTILLGGAAAPAGLLAAARAAGARVVTTYGMSETCGGCVYDGEPLDGVRAGIGGDGRIRLSGPMLFSGYRLRPDLTAAALDGGWFRTSDLGAMEGGRLRVLGRADDVINTGGEKVVAAAVAAVVAGHPAVTDAVVVGRPDPEWGERVVAVIVSPAPPSLAELRAYAKERLPAYAAPAKLVVLPEIPLLVNGKPDLEALRYGHHEEP